MTAPRTMGDAALWLAKWSLAAGGGVALFVIGLALLGLSVVI
jgi:hypothetical protein